MAAAADATAQAVVPTPAFPLAEWFMYVLLAGLMIGLVVSVWKAQRDQTISFNLFDLVVGPDGRLVPENCIVMVAFTLHSWTILSWIVTRVVTTADFVSYGMIWVAPTIVKLLRGRQPMPREVVEEVVKKYMASLPPSPIGYPPPYEG